MLKLLYSDGAPKGITFRRHKQNPNSFVIRVNGSGQTTDIGADPNNMPECYEKAIDKRLELLGIQDDADAWQTLASAYGAFLTHYGVTIKPVAHYEFEIKGK
jgi:hypothetical protein